MGCLTLIAEDESDEWQMCFGTLHALVALMIFSLFDFTIVLISILLYGRLTIYYLDWSNMIPLMALLASMATFWSVLFGICNQDRRYLWAYTARLTCISVFAFSFSMVCLFMDSDYGAGFFAIFGWFMLTFPYLMGTYFAENSVDFLDHVYRGYDYGDPVRIPRMQRKPISNVAFVANTRPSTFLG